ncbi:MAG: response regulator transcription factor [bacterium]|nr:response regulator transcription factor [bacterium]
MKTIRVAIADDHALTRKGIVGLLSEHKEFEVVAEHDSVKSMMQDFYPEQCDVLVLDVHFGDGSGIEVLQHLKLQKKNVPVLVFSYHSETQLALRALKAGANGFLSKTAPTDEILQAILKLAAGGTYLSPSIAADVALQALQQEDHITPHNALSNREFQVLCLIGAGHTHKEIATKLSINVKTVSTFKARVLEKMGLKTTAELISYVIDHRLAFR